MKVHLYNYSFLGGGGGGVSVHLTTLLSGQAVNQYLVHILSLVTDSKPS